jgi:hypothetical protein
MKRVIVAIVVIVASFTLTMPLHAMSANAQTSSATSTTVLSADTDSLGRSLPKPNSGQKPQSFGDRGGAGQLIVFGLVTAFLAAIVLRIALATRKRTKNQQLP